MSIQAGHDDAKNNNDIATQFVKYQMELDRKNDKHERLVKSSRDITIASKRCIFLLHRALNDSSKQEEVLLEAKNKLDEIQIKQWSKIVAKVDNDDRYLYARAYWPGLEEFVEAMTYYYYLKESKLISLSQFIDLAPLPGKLLTAYDFAAGIADLSGELMRLCINASGSGGESRCYRICVFIRVIYKRFVGLSKKIKGLTKKCHQVQQNLAKIENTCYELKLRKAEVLPSA
ncbi:uncharacterized protein TRIADDRAFT_32160 [Trichoplax adhaerens]|uniref:Translin n=1 Tax=Trichoplax adhaerens TaxID=10228 RepID=B3SAH4_TRIAD|nr:hypothetical protein TRIADDRAFT_32160 [Trichoplax adhaerens]EDV20313.1 hypothetical protein TRIADDRAFT_32160 [Trichoplax adhaerens]|eukprot:XP_002117263.1 hypothetical protein TRIADDRAFT_32160 [Trichoplax adhaerens]